MESTDLSGTSGVLSSIAAGMEELHCKGGIPPPIFGSYNEKDEKIFRINVGSTSVPPRATLGDIFSNERSALLFLERLGVIDPQYYCPHCGNRMRPMSTSLKSKSRFVLRCRSRKCPSPKPYATSLLRGSLLANCRHQKNKFIDLVYCWLLGNPSSSIQTSLGWSSSTTTDWTNYLRESVAADLLNDEEEVKIGGPGIVVEIDESKFGKRKYHVRISRVFLMIERHFLTRCPLFRGAVALKDAGYLAVSNDLSPNPIILSKKNTSGAENAALAGCSHVLSISGTQEH